MSAGKHGSGLVQGLVRRSLATRADVRPVAEVLPIWLAALVSARCQVNGNGRDHAVRWSCVSGRATYTNAGADTELIEPLGVHLERGQTLAVCWLPGETNYSVEVYWQNEMCA